MSTFKINAGSSPRRSFAFLVFGAIALLSVVAAWLASSFLHRAELEAQHTGHAIQAADGQTATAANLSTYATGVPDASAALNGQAPSQDELIPTF